MRINHLTLTNFGPHVDGRYEFGDGVTAIVGPNGAGKTFILRAIEYALTGDLSGPGVKGEHVNFAQPKGPSRVSLSGTHDGAAFEIRRDLLASAESSVQVGEKLVRGERDVKQELSRFFGESFSFLSRFVFLRQGEIGDLFTATPGKRMETLTGLFHLEVFERLWKAIGEETAKLPLTVATESAYVSRLREDRDAKFSLHETAAASLAALPSPQTGDDTVVVDMRRGAALASAITAMERIAVNAPVRDRAAAAVATAERGLADAEAVLSQAVASDSRTREALRHAGEAHERWNKRRELTEVYDAAVSTAESRRLRIFGAGGDPKTKEHWKNVSEAVSASITALETRHKLSLDYLRVAELVDEVCPVCATVIADRKAMAAMHREAIVELERELKVARDAYVFAGQVHRYWVEVETCEIIRAKLDACGDATGGSPAEIDALRSAASAADASLRRANANEQEARRTHRQASAALQSADLDLGVAARALKDSGCEGMDLAAINAEYLRLREAAESRAAAKAVYDRAHTAATGAKRDLDGAESMLTTARTRELAVLRSVGRRRHLDNVRELVHRNGLPRLVVLDGLRILAGDVNDALAKVNAKFRVEVDETEYFYRARLQTGGAVRAAFLSGGQQTFLSLVFAQELHRRFAGNFGLLTLDEPTLFLDDEAIAALVDALSLFRERGDAIHRQIILVTHEERVAAACDAVIRI